MNNSCFQVHALRNMLYLLNANFEKVRNPRISKTEELMIAWFKEDIESINKATGVLSYSLEKCTKISLKSNYTMEELDVFENLTSRFARTSDIYTQKS